jgi:N-acetylornithine carbamoyltransferase
MRGCAPNEDLFAPARKFRPDGFGHDIACSSTGILQLAGSPEVVVCSPENPASRLGFFVFPLPESFNSNGASRVATAAKDDSMALKHFLNTQDWSRTDLDALLTQAALFKRSKLGSELKGKSVALVFFNPSMRTRTSFELGTFQLGGHAVVLQPGKDAWPIEFDLGTVMDGDTEEHIAEVAQVLGRYADIVAVRAFPKFVDWAVDREDRVLKSFAKYCPVPVINMETITHPCQELAHIMALQEHFGTQDLRGKKYVLTWTYHPKPLNTAVANSALTIATRMGMDVTLLCPTPEYVLDERYMGWAQDNADESGGSIQVSHDINSAYANADVVYAKSWGALPYFGNWGPEKPIRDQYKHFIVDQAKMALTNNGVFSHCLPLRRNVKATDAIMDSPQCIAINEAENRLHVQKAIMAALISQ